MWSEQGGAHGSMAKCHNTITCCMASIHQSLSSKDFQIIIARVLKLAPFMPPLFSCNSAIAALIWSNLLNMHVWCSPSVWSNGMIELHLNSKLPYSSCLVFDVKPGWVVKVNNILNWKNFCLFYSSHVNIFNRNMILWTTFDCFWSANKY